MVFRPSSIPAGGRALSPDERLRLERDMQAIVDGTHLFRSLDTAARRDLVESAFVMQFEPGDALVRQNDLGDTMYLVMEGTVRVIYEGPEGLVELAELGRGACLGEVSVLTGNPRTATILAQTDVTTAVLARHRVQRILDAHPKVRSLLEALIEGRARATVERIVGS